ncbi:MAG: hypothetical protein HC834_03675 [Rhodospirillales bacterium]|nr:hypothetical protein [Rhodospirillales bacterium]
MITSNNTRDLSDALKRRCLHLFISYPEESRELEIVRLKVPGLSEALAAQVVHVIRRMRSLDLRKAPSISETLDWAQALVLLNAERIDRQLIEETLQLLIKYDRDTQRVSEHVAWLLEGGPGHTHEHGEDDGHEHGHDHGNGHHHHHHPHADRHAHNHGRSSKPRPPLRPAEPDLRDMQAKQLEHTARYFSGHGGRVDGESGER